MIPVFLAIADPKSDRLIPVDRKTVYQGMDI
jgi:hypothetical protein